MTATTPATGHDMLALMKQVNDLTRQLTDLQADLGYEDWYAISRGRPGVDEQPFGMSDTEWMHLKQDATLTECSICGGLCRLGSYIVPQGDFHWEFSRTARCYAVCTVCDHAEEM